MAKVSIDRKGKSSQKDVTDYVSESSAATILRSCIIAMSCSFMVNFSSRRLGSIAF